MIPTSVLRAVRAGFGLGRGTARVLSTRFGKVCLAHRDHTGTRLQLRLVRETHDTESRLRSEMSWLRHLHDRHHLAVPFPQQWVTGNVVSPPIDAGDDGVWRGIACRWVRGRHLNAGLDARAMRRAGEFLARMHRANRDVPPGIVNARPTWWIPRLFELAATLRDLVHSTVAPPADVPAGVVSDLRHAHVALVAAHATLLVGEHVEGLIHTDAHWQNLRFNQWRVGLVDFEDFATGRFMLDVACLWGKVEERRNARQLLDATLDGYASVSPLPQGYARDLHVMLAFRRFDYAGWVLSWPRRDVHAWGPGVLSGLRAYVDHHLTV